MNLLTARIKACTEILHVLSLTADAACTRITACNNFTEYSKVGRYAEVTLSTCHTDTEACNNLIEYEECAVFAAKTLNALNIFNGDGGSTALGAYRLHINGCCAAAELVESELSLKLVKIVRSSLLNEHKAVERNTVSLCKLGAVYADTVSHLI